jgi:lipopolysaccharide transport system permease protein
MQEGRTITPGQFSIGNRHSPPSEGGEGAGSLVVIEPLAGWRPIDFRELREYRDLFFFLVWRDIKVRYAQTVLGVAWAVLQPLIGTIIFTVVFGRFAGVPSDGVPFSLFALAALVPWTYFATSLSGASASLVSSTNLLTKVYFPRLVIPLAPVLAGLVDLAVGFLALLILMAIYGVVPSASALVAVPLLVLIALLAAGGIGSGLAALSLQYRDVKHATPFLVQVWMFLSPVVYPLSLVPENYRLLYALNPMVGVIEGFRTVLLGTGSAGPAVLGVSAASAVVLFVGGTVFFRRWERSFADVA